MDAGRALVVGGGIGGMSASLLLRARGWGVDLVEQDADWRVYGAGISITAPTFRAFRDLGVLEDVRALGFCSRTDGYLCAASGKPIMDLPMPPFAPGMPHAGGIMRPKLHEILASRVRAVGVDIRLGVAPDALHQDAGGASMTTTDGETRRYDLVVGADGMFSQVRTLLAPHAPRPFYTGQFCWRLVAPRPAEIDRPHFYMAGEVTAGLMPVSQDLMYLWLLENSPEKVRLDPATQHLRLAELMAPFGGPLATLRDSLTTASPIVSRPLESVLVTPPWHVGCVGLIGDAAHATTPHLASGAGMAVEDALALAEALDGAVDAPSAFAAFTNRRWPRCRMVVENSIGIGRMQQTQASPERLNALMGQSHKALLDAY